MKELGMSRQRACREAFPLNLIDNETSETERVMNWELSKEGALGKTWVNCQSLDDPLRSAFITPVVMNVQKFNEFSLEWNLRVHLFVCLMLN